MDASNSAELQQFLEQEKQKAVLNELVGKLTDVCWDKCITSTPGSKFSSAKVALVIWEHIRKFGIQNGVEISKTFQELHIKN